MKTINLAPKAYLIMVLDRIFKSMILSIILLITMFFSKNIPGIKDYHSYITMIVLLILLLLVIYTFIMPYIITKTTRLIIKTDSIEYQRGLIFSKRSFIPIATLQQVETSTNIISEKLNGSSLILSTAFLTIKTKVLDSNDTTQIVEYLLQQRTKSGQSNEN